MRRRRLGTHGPEVSAIGLECTGENGSGASVVDRALELGIDFFDVTDLDRTGAGAESLRRAVTRHTRRVVLSLTASDDRGPKRPGSGAERRPDHVMDACDASLRRLGLETIDLYVHQADGSDVAIEDTIGAMADLVRAGKVRWLGVSGATPALVRRAHGTYPLSSVAIDYSLWARQPGDDLLALCRELGISLVAGNSAGFLTASMTSEDALRKSLVLLAKVQSLARDRGWSPTQLALAWILARGEHVISLSGAHWTGHLEENVRAADLELPVWDLKRLERASRPPDAGSRAPVPGLRVANG